MRINHLSPILFICLNILSLTSFAQIKSLDFFISQGLIHSHNFNFPMISYVCYCYLTY